MSREIKEEIREYLETNENKNTIFQTMGLSKSSLVSEVIDTSLLQETRIITNNLPCHLKELEKEELPGSSPG